MLLLFPYRDRIGTYATGIGKVVKTLHDPYRPKNLAKKISMREISLSEKDIQSRLGTISFFNWGGVFRALMVVAVVHDSYSSFLSEVLEVVSWCHSQDFDCMNWHNVNTGYFRLNCLSMNNSANSSAVSCLFFASTTNLL